MKQITSQKEFDSLISKAVDKGTRLECFVMLNFGLRSSKSVTFADTKGGNDYEVLNEIDDSEEVIEHDKLMDSFPIGKALKYGALYAY